MTLRNRVDPFSALVADPARGTLTGNRGCLHDEQRRIHPGQTWRSRRWIACALDWKGRRRKVMSPNRWTELFFLDEATALAAGHRPCAYCRRPGFVRFRAALISGERDRLPPKPNVEAIDRLLHGDRLTGQGTQRRFSAVAADLPSGAMFEHQGRAWKIAAGRVLSWSFNGYGPAAPMPVEPVDVLTPRAIVAVLRAGYDVSP